MRIWWGFGENDWHSLKMRLRFDPLRHEATLSTGAFLVGEFHETRRMVLHRELTDEEFS